MSITVTPAHGRDYKSAAAAQSDWAADKDFVAQPHGAYINRSQAVADGLEVWIRYDRLCKKVLAK